MIAQRPIDQPGLLTHVMGVARFEHFFRAAAALDMDKADLKRHSDFINHKLHDLLVCAEAAAKANGRDVIQPFDLPITKGLQGSIQAFQHLDEDIALKPILDRLTERPSLDLDLDPETEARLPTIVGGLSVALACAFKLIEPGLKNPRTEHWQRAFKIFDLLL
jgi:hypothetical protein